MRKKSTILFVLIMAIGLISFILTGCWGNQDNGDKGSDNNKDTLQSLELSLSNYEYYLSIDQVKTDSGSAMAGRFRWVTISGAINGLFQNCSLYYKIGDGEEKEVKLNAAGFASFDYTWTNNSGGDFSFTRAEGQIII